LAGKPRRVVDDPVLEARRTWERLRKQRRADPSKVTETDVQLARARWLAADRDRQLKIATGGVGVLQSVDAAVHDDATPTEAAGRVARPRYFTDPDEAERAGRLEVLLLVLLDDTEDLELDEAAERAWLLARPAVMARVMRFFARRALGGSLRAWLQPGIEEREQEELPIEAV
jgi:hypothetical protein